MLNKLPIFLISVKLRAAKTKRSDCFYFVLDAENGTTIEELTQEEYEILVIGR